MPFGFLITRFCLIFENVDFWSHVLSHDFRAHRIIKGGGTKLEYVITLDEQDRFKVDLIAYFSFDMVHLNYIADTKDMLCTLYLCNKKCILHKV